MTLRRAATELVRRPPDGYINYSPDGRMFVSLVSSDQPRPTDDVPTDAEPILLHKSMLAYGGSCFVDGSMVIEAAKGMNWTGPRGEVTIDSERVTSS